MRFDRIAEFTLSGRDIPQSALDMAATLLIDTVGVAAGATGLAAGRIARDHAFVFHGAGAPEHAASMMFDGRRASVPVQPLPRPLKLTTLTRTMGSTKPRAISAVLWCPHCSPLPKISQN